MNMNNHKSGYYKYDKYASMNMNNHKSGYHKYDEAIGSALAYFCSRLERQLVWGFIDDQVVPVAMHIARRL